jgi:DtxR family Mn-dependent transcriptional regulator
MVDNERNDEDLKLSSSLEDYLETIYLIQKEQSVARIKDIAAKMEVSAPSVTGAMKSLKKVGLVEHSSYGYVELSEEGRKKAAEIFHLHETLTEFLHRVLGLEYDKAETDACKIEHALEPETADRLAKFMEFALNSDSDCGGCAARFNEFYNAGEIDTVDNCE